MVVEVVASPHWSYTPALQPAPYLTPTPLPSPPSLSPPLHTIVPSSSSSFFDSPTSSFISLSLFSFFSLTLRRPLRANPPRRRHHSTDPDAACSRSAPSTAALEHESPAERGMRRRKRAREGRDRKRQLSKHVVSRLHCEAEELTHFPLPMREEANGCARSLQQERSWRVPCSEAELVVAREATGAAESVLAPSSSPVLPPREEVCRSSRGPLPPAAAAAAAAAAAPRRRRSRPNTSTESKPRRGETRRDDALLEASRASLAAPLEPRPKGNRNQGCISQKQNKNNKHSLTCVAVGGRAKRQATHVSPARL